MKNKNIEIINVDKFRYKKLITLFKLLKSRTISSNYEKIMNFINSLEEDKEYFCNKLLSSIINNNDAVIFVNEKFNNLNFSSYTFKDIFITFYEVYKKFDITKNYFIKYNKNKSDNLNFFLSSKDSDNTTKQTINKLFKVSKLQEPEKKVNEATEIVNFVDKTTFYKQILNKNKLNRETCSKCSFFKNESYFFETNATEYGKVDFSIVIFNPPEGDEIKVIEKFKEIFKNRTYIIYCIISCKKGISLFLNEKEIANSCLYFYNEINIKYPSKNTIFCGQEVKKYLKLKGVFSKVVWNKLNNNQYLIESVSKMVNGKPSNLLDSFLLQFKQEEKKELNVVTTNLNIPKEKIITKISSEYTLFNIFTKDEMLIYIFLDKDGNKKYYLENIKFPLYIKQGNFKDCEYIDNKMDLNIFLNGKEKQDLLNLLRRNSNVVLYK